MAQSVFLSATQAPSSKGVSDSDFLSLVFISVSSKNEPPSFDLDDLRNSVKDETENDFLLRADLVKILCCPTSDRLITNEGNGI